MRTTLLYYWGKPQVPSELAKARAIDLSIQFSLFWMPFFVLLAWWVNKPLHLLFGMGRNPYKGLPIELSSSLDIYEVAVLVSSAFLVNHITADAKTNWVRRIYWLVFSPIDGHLILRSRA